MGKLVVGNIEKLSIFVILALIKLDEKEWRTCKLGKKLKIGNVIDEMENIKIKYYGHILR